MKKILSMMILAVLVLLNSGCEEKNEPAPQITEGEFPFVLEYELDGQRYLIEDTVVCEFDGYDLSNSFSLTNSRTWYQHLESENEEKRVLIEFEPNSKSVFTEGRINIESKVVLNYGDGGYYMGDPSDLERGPCINYIEQYEREPKVLPVEFTKLNFEQLEEYFGIKIIRFEFSEPIENTFK